MGTFALVLVLSGCSEIIPPASLPTAPTAAAPAAVVALELLPGGPDFASGSAQITVRTRGADGSLVGADVTCTASSGQLFPARLDTTFRPSIELAATTVRTRVACSTGDVQAAVDVDMSAWRVELMFNQFTPIGPGAGESRVLIVPTQRIANVTATRMTIDWGDGALDVVPFSERPGQQTMFHRYARAGLYVAKGRIDWPGGTFERLLTIAGGPAVH